MILIAEGGSTKCDWVIIDNQLKESNRVKTVGFNPYFHNAAFVEDVLRNTHELNSIKDDVEFVFFYGAGCSSKDLNLKIHEGLQTVFNSAIIDVDHDLCAAAHALYEGEPIISCIIGTGSNSGFFDGENMHETVPALGYILGDEASGSYFGKRVMADYFYNRLPTEMQIAFKEEFNLSWHSTIPSIYENRDANVYLASFMKFIAGFSHTQYVRDMVAEGMGKFIDVHVMSFDNYEKYKVGFVGSIAHIYRDILEAELEKRGCQLGKIIKSPVDSLVKYRRDRINIKTTA
jgi:glucosamine kinase